MAKIKQNIKSTIESFEWEEVFSNMTPVTNLILSFSFLFKALFYRIPFYFRLLKSIKSFPELMINSIAHFVIMIELIIPLIASSENKL